MKTMTNGNNSINESGISFRLLEAAFEAAAHSTVIADREGRIVWVNPAFTRMTGYTSAEAIGRKTSLLRSGEQDASFYEDLWQTIFAGETWRGTLVNRHKDGHVYLEKQAITPILRDSGQIGHFIAVKEDITEVVRTQELLRTTSDRYQRLFDKSPLALWEEDYSAAKIVIDELRNSGVTDLRAYFDEHPEAVRSCASMIEIIDVNEAGVKMFGAADKDQVLGNLGRLFNETSYDNLKEQLVWLAAGHLHYESEAENMTSDGEKIVVDLKLNIAPEFSSCWSEVILSLENITPRKLREEQLAHALKMEAIGQLTSGIAHDFNNVLTVISGNLRLITDMSEQKLGEETGEMLADALSAADDGAQLTSRLLAFSRKPVSDDDLTSIEEVIVEFADLMKRTLGNGIDIDVRLADGLVSVKTDGSAFRNVLLNLSFNARDAMRDGGRLTFSARNGAIEPGDAANKSQWTESTPCMIVEVTDTGIGMSADVLERAIEPFFTTKDIDEGSGLGLSVVYDFVSRSNGDLRIESTLDKGTTVALRLPLPPVDAHIDKTRN